MQQTVERRPYLRGQLEVHVITNSKTGDTTEFFTLASLADVLSISRTTLEGRYNRTNARVHKVDIPNGPGRPIRGFPIDLLETITHAFTSTGATFANNIPDTPPPEPGMAQHTEYNGERYYTPQALADYYGVSVSTVRNRLRVSGMMNRLVPLVEHPRAGRPPVALHERDLSDAHLAIHHQLTMVNDGAAQLARSASRAFPESVPAPRTQLTRLTPPSAQPNLILDALRGAGMTSDQRPQRVMSTSAQSADLIQELTQWIEALPASEPAPDTLEDVVVTRLADHEDDPQWVSAASPAAWMDSLREVILRLIARRQALDYDWLEHEAVRLNGTGAKWGLTVPIAHVTEYVETMRARLRQHLQPYEQVITTTMDDYFPEGGNADPVVALAFLRTMPSVPVYESQLPIAELDARAESHGTKSAWKTLRRPKNDAERAARERVLDSAKFRQAAAGFESIFAKGVQDCDNIHGIRTILSQDHNGQLVFPTDPVYYFKYPQPIDNR